MSANASPSKDEKASSGSPASITELISIDLTTPTTSPKPTADEDFDKVPSLIGDELSEYQQIILLLGWLAQNTFTASEQNPMVQIAQDKVIVYLERDYLVFKINNHEGVLSVHYPSTIPYIIGETGIINPAFQNLISSSEFHDLIGRAHNARCRQRFPVTVIHFQGKSICRSATLAGVAEIYGRMTFDVFRPGPSSAPEGEGKVDSLLAAEAGETDESTWKAITNLQTADITLLKLLNVRAIVDLMVENKKLKLGVPVTSSEKADKENRYHQLFQVLSLPFPGCEFFKQFHDNNYIAEGLHYDWSQSMCDAELHIPEGYTMDHLNINWAEYKQWDIVQMTQNYIKYILHFTHESDYGVLIHCISGWDRTPLFISLIRMSLWADGLVHKSLNVSEMLYFTLAYDWMLFGHHLADRLSKKEDNLLFCFNVLKHLIDDQFSVNPRPSPMKRPKSCVCSSDSEEPSPKKHIPRKCVCCGDKDRGESTRRQPSPECFIISDDSDESLDNYQDSSSMLFRVPPATGPYWDRRSEGIQSYSLYDPEAGPSQPGPSTQKTLPIDMPSTSRGTGTQTPGLSGSWGFVTSTGSDVASKSSQGSTDEFSRSGRLTSIRRLFYKCYYQALTDKHVNYTNVNMLQSIIRNLNEITNLHK